MSLGPLNVVLGKVSVQVLHPFFNWIVCPPSVSSLYILEIKPMSNASLGKYIFAYGWFIFHFADVFFSCAEAFYFDEVPFVYFSLYVPCSRGTYQWKRCCMEFKLRKKIKFRQLSICTEGQDHKNNYARWNHGECS